MPTCYSPPLLKNFWIGKLSVAVWLLAILGTPTTLVAQAVDTAASEMYRPQIHFSPARNWMNDPNGLVYYKNRYHLFFQYHPFSSVWGPMHWGHAVSNDLIHWTRKPVAIFPDSLGMIFSGSAVVDKNNTSGLGKNQEPLVAIFTQHDSKAEKEGKNNFQNQSLAYSLDNGNTWIKYAHNPVLINPGLKDFRDPKVIWYQPQKKWIMTLATGDRITFYSSPDLKRWTKESEFGRGIGAHGGVWECPDLFPLRNSGKTTWVLIVNLNPGGPNKGSATQYFLGDFDGKRFLPFNTDEKWLDYGPDEYAGVTWSNTSNRRIFLGWMSNWLYANLVPTYSWRNAMTIPRELELKHANHMVLLASTPVREFSALISKPVIAQHVTPSEASKLIAATGDIKLPCYLKVQFPGTTGNFSITLSNDNSEEILIGFDKEKNRYFIDRTRSGKTDFQKDFAGVYTAPRFSDSATVTLTLIFDVSSVELFADNGLTVMTCIFFPHKLYSRLGFQSGGNTAITKMEYAGVKSIWGQQ